MEFRENQLKLLAIGYLWDATQGRASQEAMRYFGDGAVWATEGGDSHCDWVG